MCKHSFRRHRHGTREAETFFVVVVAMIRKALVVLANARRDLEDIARGDAGVQASRPAQTHIKPTEKHLNVPL